jgi:hypothetical protein
MDTFKQGWCHQCISVAYSYPVIYSHYIADRTRRRRVCHLLIVPELSSLQTAELEIFNATVRAQGEAGLDATWNDVFKGEYKRLAAAVTGNLTESRGTLTAIWTCWAASSAEGSTSSWSPTCALLHASARV